MDLLWKLLISNAAIAGGLFMLVLLIRRWIKNPALQHMLLLLVLIKLITPAVWQPQIALLSPGPGSSVSPVEKAPVTDGTGLLAENESNANTELNAFDSLRKRIQETSKGSSHSTTTETVSKTSTAEASTETPVSNPALYLRLATSFTARGWTWTTSLFLIWAVGTLVCCFIAALRIFRFQRLLKLARPASAALQQRAGVLGTRIGLESAPQVVLLPGAISPLLWAFCCRAQIILPERLLAELDEEEQDTLLLHELAHYRRGDHWVRLIELVTTALYWWYPVVWWVRREIRLTEEACCDAWVIQTIPDKRRAYAEVLVKATGFVSQAQRIPVATGMGSARILEQRLTSIMCDSLQHQISRRGKFLLATIALLLLSLAPLPGTSHAETKVAEKPDQLPSVEEILNGYRDNIQRLLPLEMTYRITAQENMNCITRDRQSLKALKHIQNADRNEVKFGDKVLSEQEFQMMVAYSIPQQEMFLQSQLTPEAVRKRLSETEMDQRFFWTDGRAFHQRRPYQLRQKNTTLEQGPVWPAENLNQHYNEIELISWSDQNQPPLRRWYGRKKRQQFPQGEIGNELKQISNLKTTAPLGLNEYHWAEELPEYSLDACLTKPSHRYRVVGRENRDGRTLILVEYLNEPHEQSPEKRWRMRAWVDPAQGYLPLRIEWGYVDQEHRLAWGFSQHAEVLQVKQVDGSFYPTRIKYQEYTSDVRKEQEQYEKLKPENRLLENFPVVPTVPGRSTIWEVLDVQPHQQIPPETLALRFPEGTVYENLLDGQNYVTGTEEPLPEPPRPPEMLPLFSQAPPLQVVEWLDGNQHQLHDFEGKVVALLFISGTEEGDYSKIPPDAQEQFSMMLKLMKAFHTKYSKQGVVFVEIHSPGTTKEAIRTFHQFRKFETLAAIDQGNLRSGMTNIKFNGSSRDVSLFLIGRDGTIAMNQSLLEGDHAELYYHRAAHKLSIPLKFNQSPSMEEGMRIVEFMISEQIDYALAGKKFPFRIPVEE
ncbi:MAG: M56 family metallopeptidase [Gimesia chilikensis]|uniref:M56 family metallopeptidase n=1 Tax=Gimesia chilikensis TaxID=2605989 RepID=UPI003788BBDA